jgi:hypothetical protein
MTYTFQVEPLTIEEAKEIGHGVLWKTIHDTMPEFSEKQLATVISFVVETCPFCHSENRHKCYCWNDE